MKEYEKIDIKPKSPNLVIIGNIAYDIIDFSKLEEKRPNIIDIGGACVFSTIPASLFHRVGMVGKIGKDLDISQFYGYNIDLSGVKTLDMTTTRFYTIWNTADGQDRTVTGDVKTEMEVGSEDIPKNFLGAKHFHLTTATPEKQLELIEFLRSNTNATISVDTIDEFAQQPILWQTTRNTKKINKLKRRNRLYMIIHINLFLLSFLMMQVHYGNFQKLFRGNILT